MAAPNRQQIDQLIRDVARGSQPLPSLSADQLREHVATAPFSSQRVPVSADLRGLIYEGRVVQARDDTAFAHLVKRVVADEQWAYGTTLDEYLHDLHAATRHPQSQMAIYDAGSGPVATVFAPNDIPAHRLGLEHEQNVIVIYAVNRNGIITGYQASNLGRVRIPGDAVWLS